MMVKLDIYRKFTNALAVAVIVSVGWICYEVIYNNFLLNIKLCFLHSDFNDFVRYLSFTKLWDRL